MASLRLALKKSLEEAPTQWIQCDQCSKWRVLPSHVDVLQFPEQWYCKMNIYDPMHDSCDAAEQTLDEIKRRFKRRKLCLARLQARAAQAAADRSRLAKKETKPEHICEVTEGSPRPTTSPEEKRDLTGKNETKNVDEGIKTTSGTNDVDDDEQSCSSQSDDCVGSLEPAEVL